MNHLMVVIFAASCWMLIINPLIYVCHLERYHTRDSIQVFIPKIVNLVVGIMLGIIIMLCLAAIIWL